MPEEQVMEDADDEEIFEAVQKMYADREHREINGGDDDPQDFSGEPKPTRNEALHAISTLSKYLADIDGAFARKLEVGLAAFGREAQYEETQQLVLTSITDYFTRK
ncbi:hypothetical protein FB451DRAFT_1131871 [Mycena latifolia]|nr:hypothetical protein FB451DRAFT_1131871 [Mycena latifolia]